MKTIPFAFSLTALLLTGAAAKAGEFSDYDTNKDGQISKAEFAAQAASLPPAVAMGPGKAALVPEPEAKPEKSGWIAWLERDFQIRESFFTQEQAVNPAKLSWTKAKGEPSFYQLDAAVLWQPTFLTSGTTIGSKSLSWFIRPSFEAHVSTETGASQDQLTYRVPLTLNLTHGGAGMLAGMDTPGATPAKRFITVHTLLVSPTYQTDRHNATRTLEAEIFYTPTIPSLAMGVRQPLFGTDWLHLLWRPYAGVELGEYLERDATTKLALERSVSRFVARAEAEVLFGERFAVTGSYVLRRELQDAERTFHYGEVSGILLLDTVLPASEEEQPHFTAGVTYKRGQDAPEFEDVDVVTAWLGVRF